MTLKGEGRNRMGPEVKDVTKVENLVRQSWGKPQRTWMVKHSLQGDMGA